MRDDESIDQFAGKLSGLASRAVNLGEIFDDSTLMKKLLDAVPERFFHLAATMEQCLNLDTMAFEDAVGRLKAFEERLHGKEIKGETQGKLLFNQTDGRNKNVESARRGRGNGNNNYRGRGNGRGRGRGGRGREREPTQNRNEDRNGQNRDKSHIQCSKCEKYDILHLIARTESKGRLKQIL